MVEDLLRDFVEENFGKGYLPLPHGSTEAAKPFGLMVKKKRRSIYDGAYTILEGLEKYVQLYDSLFLEGHEERGQRGFQVNDLISLSLSLSLSLSRLRSQNNPG